MRRNRSSSFTFPDFSFRRLLMQARAARGSPTLNNNGNRCDIEKGASSTSKSEKSSTSVSSNNKVRVICGLYNDYVLLH